MAFPTPIYSQLLTAQCEGRRQIAVLLDPDKFPYHNLSTFADIAHRSAIDYFFVGGSLLFDNQIQRCVEALKQVLPHIPVILFPGNVFQITPAADAILFLSLVSGRNPDLLIGQHVIAAPILKRSNLEVIPTGYMLIDGGKPTTASYISNTLPLPHDKPQIAVCTAMAAELLGMKLLYLDAGSGAQNPVSATMIAQVAANTPLPIIVGGGIKTPAAANAACVAGATLIVVGNVLEQNPEYMAAMANAVHFGL